MLRWHFEPTYPRPYFFPFRPRSATGSLTRMGHPGAPDHDHHQSIWFAHASVDGIDFWSNRSQTEIRQKQWKCYQDGDDFAAMACVLGWFDDQGVELMEQELVASLIPIDDDIGLEIQTTFQPAKNRDKVELGKTNFGFLAVRLAKSISSYFGGGTITNSNQIQNESDVFGKTAKWIDYRGPMTAGSGKKQTISAAGITFHDHPDNPRYPSRWHVREDGWMGASFCMQEGYTITDKKPLTLRYLLHAHQNTYDHDSAIQVHERFSSQPGFRIVASPKNHVQFEVRRIDPKQN